MPGEVWPLPREIYLYNFTPKFAQLIRESLLDPIPTRTEGNQVATDIGDRRAFRGNATMTLGNPLRPN